MYTDEQIISLYCKGNTGIIDVLIDKYKNDLYNLCFHFTLNTTLSDDLFQETWIKIIASLDNYVEKNFKNFMYTVCVNTYRDMYRKRKRDTAIMNELYKLAITEGNDGSKQTWSSEEAYMREKFVSELLIKKINTLSDKLRIPVILFFVQDKSYEEIAQILKVPIGTVRSRLNSARTKLKSMMEADLYGN